MNLRPTTVERAYQLAKSGGFSGATEIKARLRAEGYMDADAQIYGPTLRSDLRRLCLAARVKEGGELSR
jgi:hypothetical protein